MSTQPQFFLGALQGLTFPNIKRKNSFLDKVNALAKEIPKFSLRVLRGLTSPNAKQNSSYLFEVNSLAKKKLSVP